MVYSAFPITVDGVSLDSVAWNVDVKTRQWAASRTADVVIVGTDGVVASLNDDLDATLYTLSMWVLGTDATGVVPAGSTAMAQCRANLDALSFVFRKRWSLLNIVEVVDNAGTTRQAYGKVVDAIAPDVKAGGSARFVVNLLLPDGMWQDPNTSDWSQTGVVSGNTYEVTSLQGASESIADGVVLVTGPATNPQVTDYVSGSYCRLNTTLTAGQQWRLNAATWSTRYGTGLTLSSADSAGTDGQPVTVSGGATARLLRMVPQLSSGVRRVSLTVSGSGFTSATALAVRARRKFSQ